MIRSIIQKIPAYTKSSNKTPDDFYMFKALYDARENEQIYGM